MGKKSRAKRLAREAQGPPREHVRSRGRQSGLSQIRQSALIGLVIMVAIGLGFVAKSAFTSTSLSTPATNMSSMNADAGEPGIAVGKRVTMADMAMPASSGGNVALSKYRGKKLVVYFYEGVT